MQSKSDEKICNVHHQKEEEGREKVCSVSKDQFVDIPCHHSTSKHANIQQLIKNQQLLTLNPVWLFSICNE
jgi:hypothetical protein